VLSNQDEFEDCVQDVEQQAEELFDGYCDLEGSGWIFQYVDGLYVELTECQSLTGGCHDQSFISDHVWDGECDDGECFYVAVARHAHTHGKDSNDLILKYARDKFKECRNLVPMSVSAVDRFEKRYNLFINIILLENGDLFTVKSARPRDDSSQECINILMTPVNTDGHSIQYHYTYIRDVHSLVNELRYALGKIDHEQHRRHVYTCMNCLNYFTTKDYLLKHQARCQTHKVQTIEMPDSGSRCEFTRIDAVQKAPLIGAFDFETKMIEGGETTNQSTTVSTHRVVSYSLVIITSENEIIFERNEQSENNCLDLFLEALADAEALIDKILKRPIPMNMTKDDVRSFKQSKTCYICQCNLSDDGDKVRDHCHFTGQYLGSAHKLCNLQRKAKFKLPMYAHNFTGYDSHFLMQAFATSEKYQSQISAMAFSTQKIRTITTKRYKFIDSMHFLSEALHKIIEDLVKSGHDFKILRKSGLCSNAYDHGKAVFEAFRCKSMAEYLKLYNHLDVYLLLEAVTAFRNVGWKEFGLDAAHFISLPQYGFQW